MVKNIDGHRLHSINRSLSHTPDELRKPIGIWTFTDRSQQWIDESAVKVTHLASTGGRKFDSARCADKGVTTIGRVVQTHPHPGRHALARG